MLGQRTELVGTAALERFPVTLTWKSLRSWPGSALDSMFVAFPFGKPVSTFPGNALSGASVLELPAIDQPRRDPDQDRQQDDAEARKRERRRAEKIDQRCPEREPQALGQKGQRGEARRWKLQNAGRGGDERGEIGLPEGGEDRAEAILGQPAFGILQWLAQPEGEQEPIPAVFADEKIRHLRAIERTAGGERDLNVGKRVRGGNDQREDDHQGAGE